MRRSRRIPLVLFLLALPVALAIGDDLRARVARLLGEGHPDLALAILEDEEGRGRALGDDMGWLRARLVPDGDRFDRLAAQLSGGRPADDPFAQEVLLARAREQFARGRYLSALENLRALPADAIRRWPEIVLFRAMAAQAVGEVRGARLDLEAITEDAPTFAQAQALLADLRLRAREPEAALRHASRALDEGGEFVGAQALYVRAVAYGQLGRDEDAEDARRDLLRRFPRSVEATWLRQEAATEPLPVRGAELAEAEAPPRRDEFALQLGAFHDRSLALRHAHRLRDSVEDLRIERDVQTSPPWYRVVGGHYRSRSEADRAQAKLRESGIDSVVLSPGQSGP